MAKNLNQGQGQVKSKGEEENTKPKPGLWKRITQILKPAALIAVATIGFLLVGPIGIALALGISAFVSHKIDQKNARKNADKDNKGNKGNKGNKNNSDSRDKENKKEGKGPGFLKRALFIAGAITLGALTGGLVGAAVAIALIVSDLASGGKLTKWSEKVVMTPVKLIKEAWLKGKEIQWTSKRGAGKETEQKTGQEAAGKERETGKEQAAGRGVAGKGRGDLPAGFSNPHYSPKATEAPLVGAENPNASVVTAEGTVPQSLPDGQRADGNPTNKTMSREVQEEVAQAGAGFAEAANSVGGVTAAGTRSPSNGQEVDGSTSKQPVPPKTQGQAAQPANSSDGRRENADKKLVVGPASGKVVEDASRKAVQGDSKGRVPG